MAERRGRDGIVIGLMVILTYFLTYTFMKDTSIMASLGGLPLIECTTSLIRDGFSGAVMSALTKDFAQTIIVVFVVVFVQNLIPEDSSRGPRAVIAMIIGYVVLLLISIWFVRFVVFSSKMNQIVQMFLSIFCVVVAGLGAFFSTPLRGLISERMAGRFLRDYFMDSRIAHWFADSFFISAVILFLAVAIEMTVGLPYFFTAVVAGFPAIVTMLVMAVLLYNMIKFW